MLQATQCFSSSRQLVPRVGVRRHQSTHRLPTRVAAVSVEPHGWSNKLRVESVDMYRTVTIVLLANAVVPGLPLPPAVITCLHWFGNILGALALLWQVVDSVRDKERQDWDPFVLVHVDGESYQMERGALIEAFDGSDADSASSSIGTAVYDILHKDCPDAFSVEFYVRGVKAVSSVKRGRRGVYFMLIRSEKIVITTM